MHLIFPKIDAFSFWFGVVLSTLVWWIVALLRPVIQNIGESIQTRRATQKEKTHAASAVENYYRQSVLIQAQGLHLAAPLFSLDEIVVPPALLAPPPRVEPGAPLLNEDIVAAAVPYLPTWPGLGAIYRAPTLTLAQALSGNSDIVLTGQAGMGKTVALAYLATRLARKDPEPGLALETIPFLIHVADLDLQVKKEDPLNPIIDLVAGKSPVIYLPRIPEFIKKAFTEGRALLLLDGTDEQTPDSLKNVVEFIKAIKRGFPKTRIVTTASNEYLDGLVSLNFIPFALAGWNTRQRVDFLTRWGDLWTNYVAVEAWAQTGVQVDQLLLGNWLAIDTDTLTPLELTIKTWGVFAGDIQGSRPVDILETHIRRLAPANTPREALEMLAMQLSLSAEPDFDPHKAREWIRSFEPPEVVNAEQSGEQGEVKKSGRQDIAESPSLGLITKMVESGLLAHHRNNRMRFTHPVLGGYLAGKALTNYRSESLLDQPPWIGKFLAMQYLAAFGDVSPLVDKLLSQIDRPLSRNLITPARWLRDAPRHAPWRGPLISRIVDLLQQSGQPLGLRGEALSALVQSEDPGMPALFRQLLEEQDNELLQLAALGSGALQDPKAIEILSSTTNNMDPNVRRASCLALVAIGTSAAMDVVASALLHGDENLRRAAAEAMANSHSEGYAMLKEGAAMKDDLLVRRSALYGLGRIPEQWAEELINHLQIEDDQWAVRNAAQEVTENHQRPNPHIPQRLPPPTESPWIIAFAGKQGIGVSPDKPPTDLLLLALKSGSEEERLAALAYLRIMPIEGVFGALYQAMYSGDPTLREAAFQTVSEMASRGVDVPDPVQFGVGY